MTECPVCGFRNMSSNVRCLKCRALLRDDDKEVGAAFGAADAKRDGPRFPAVAGALATLRRKNPLRRFWRLPEHLRYRFPYAAGLLSLLPGLGQLYNRQPGKGALLAVCWWTGAAACLLTIREPYSNFLLIALLLGYLMIWNDAVASAVRINGELWSFRNSLALWCAAMFSAGALITGTQFLGMNHVSFVRVLDSATDPDIRLGDIVLTNHMAYWFSKPALGEVVYFDPARFTAEQPGAVMSSSISINIKDYYQRVAGLPGDLIEKREGRVYRNGSPLPPHMEPFNADAIPDGEKFDIPLDRYWLPVTRFPTDVFGALMGAPNIKPFEKGWIFRGWHDASLVPARAIRGKGVAILHPSERRRWLREER